MSPAVLDTLKAVQKLQNAGFTRKQAAGVVEVLADAVEERPTRDGVIDAVETLGRAVDRRFTIMEQRQSAFDQRQAAFEQRQSSLEQGQAALIEKTDRLQAEQVKQSDVLAGIQAMLVKILDGQAVLHQNDMELKRRLDQLQPR
jgi:ABC-type phosphate transport system auxiliary subunit